MAGVVRPGRPGISHRNDSESSNSGLDRSYLSIRFERAAFIGLTFPSHTVRLVENGNNRSPRLPTQCDACRREIKVYPYISKHHSSYRKYHIKCAIRVGLVTPL